MKPEHKARMEAALKHAGNSPANRAKALAEDLNAAMDEAVTVAGTLDTKEDVIALFTKLSAETRANTPTLLEAIFHGAK